MKRQQTVFVRNNGTETFTDRYNGEDFEIPPGGQEEMLIECAELCLGFGEEDKTRALRRKGWAFTSVGQKEGLARLARFSFHMSEKEALAYDPNKEMVVGDLAKSIATQSHSSAPVVGGAAAGVSSDAPAAAAVQTQKVARKPGPLEKLAAANAAAG